MRIDEIRVGMQLHYLWEAGGSYRWRNGGLKPKRFEATVLAIRRSRVRIRYTKRRGVGLKEIVGTFETLVEPRKLIKRDALLPPMYVFYDNTRYKDAEAHEG